MKFKKINDLLSVSLSGNFAQTKMLAALPSMPLTEADKKVLANASLWFDEKRASVTDNIDVPQGRPVLTDERYVYKDFRALSQILLRMRGLDFSRPGVLEAAVPMILGKTVYPNHDFTDINNWVGVVSSSKWDAQGQQSDSVPGINVQIKVDAFLNYRIACGLMMSPPAINAMSLTVFFAFEYSHPQLAIDSQWKFFELLGEEVDGEIVRLIVTEIYETWEASLVFQGEDRLATGLDDTSGTEIHNFSVKAGTAAEETTPPNSTKEKTMKLTAEQKRKLGIEFDGEDVPESEIFKAGESLAEKVTVLTESTESKAVEALKAKAAQADVLIEERRTEVTRLARLAELGAEDGDLDPVITEQIAAAKDAASLQKLHAYFEKRAAEKFPAGGRSSVENSKKVDEAGGFVAETKKTQDRTAGLL